MFHASLSIYKQYFAVCSVILSTGQVKAAHNFPAKGSHAHFCNWNVEKISPCLKTPQPKPHYYAIAVPKNECK